MCHIFRFRELYRFPPALAVEFIDELQEHVFEDSDDPRKIPFHFQVLSVLHFLASGSYQRGIGTDGFIMISQTMVSRFIKKLCKIITTKLSPKYVQFPNNEEEASVVKNQFFASTQLPGIVGLIDGTHVALTNVPCEYENEYINRKNFH